MGIARKCDVCGKLYEPYNTGAMDEGYNTLMICKRTKGSDFYQDKLIKDLCPDCMNAVVDLIDRLERGEKES